MQDQIAVLIGKVASGDRAAFRDLYHASSAKLMGVSLRILGSRAEAEEALQEIFTRVWLRASRFDPERGGGMTWLIVIARNHCIDRLRARQADTLISSGSTDEETDPIAALRDPAPTSETRLIATGELGRIRACLDALETERAEAIRGAYIGGLTYDQLALRHDVPLNTMRTWLRRGLLKLRECMAS